MDIYKLLVGLGITVASVILAPLVASDLGYMPQLNDKGILILLVAAGGLIIKSLIGDIVAGEFLFYKFGYDNCVLTFGAVLTGLALQLVSDGDLFPGLANISPLNIIPSRSAQLLLLLVFSLMGTLIAARVAAAIRHQNPQGQGFLALLNSVIGVALLGVYVLVLISKEP